ncbi:MAG TPA: ferritin-like domain-containing protein [Sporichthyaceae bacterium]|nr:ferritin-like domain-containing protein [Sporichthyaceae bacterium]
MKDQIDPRLLSNLTEHSEDLHADASRLTRQALDDYGERTLEGATASTEDVKALQTAASIENLAVSVYTKAAGLSFIKDGNKVVAEFVARTMTQHTAHAKAFNAAAVKAGGKKQSGTDPKYQKVVDAALPKLKRPADVITLAITLEDVAVQTYCRNVTQVSTSELRLLFGSIAPVEAAHRAVLLAMAALLKDAPELVAIPTDPQKLPKNLCTVAVPDSFYSLDLASPVGEGAVS